MRGTKSLKLIAYGLAILGTLLSPSRVQGQKLLVAVAANARQVCQELADQFHLKTGTPVELVSASSGKLFAQISQGAPFHLFLSADTLYPYRLVSLGRSVGGMHIYAQGRLVLYSEQPLNAYNWKQTLLQMAHDSKKIALANPNQAPYGRAAWQVLKRCGLSGPLDASFVIAESISQVDLYLSLGSVNAGFTAASFQNEKGYNRHLNAFEIPREDYDPLLQGMIVLKTGDAARLREAQEFSSFILSKTGQEILSRYKYLPGPQH